jgi:hypothetical protein
MCAAKRMYSMKIKRLLLKEMAVLFISFHGEEKLKGKKSFSWYKSALFHKSVGVTRNG